MASEFSIDLDGLKALEKGLKSIPARVPNVTSMAINSALRKMYTAALKSITKTYFVEERIVKRGLTMVYANPSKTTGGLVASGKHLYLGRFRYTPTRPGTRSPVSVSLGPGKTAQVNGSAFVAVMNKQGQGYQSIYMRKGRKRFPVEQLRADIGIAEMLADPAVRKEVEAAGMAEFNAKFRERTAVEMEKAFAGMKK
jgi:hypothetical protein